MNLLFIVVLNILVACSKRSDSGERCGQANILAVGYATPDHEAGLKVEDPAIRGWRKGDHTKGVQRLLLQKNFEV